MGICIYNDEAGWIIQYIGDAESVVVPTEINGCPITTINQDAFSGNEKIRSVTISEGITQIDAHAFSNCVNLKSVSIRDGMLTIGDRAFEGCSSLTTVVLPDSATSLGEYVFYECRALKDVTLSAGLTELPDYAFSECSALERVTLPSGIRTLGAGVFQNCTCLSSANLDHLTGLGRYCFQKTALTEVTIPGSVKEIPEYCFWLCSYLVDITLENGVERICNDAFSQCGNDENKKIGDYMYFGPPRRSLFSTRIRRNTGPLSTSGFPAPSRPLAPTLWTAAGLTAFICWMSGASRICRSSTPMPSGV